MRRGEVGLGDAVRGGGHVADRPQDATGHHPGAAGREQQRHGSDHQHEAGGVVGGLPLLVGEVGDDGDAPRRVAVQAHRDGEVADLPGAGLVAAPRRVAHRADLPGERVVPAEQHRRLDAALVAVPAVDVAEELLVRPGQVVRDQRLQHVLDRAERLTGARVDIALEDPPELLDLGLEGDVDPLVGGGDEQSPGHERDDAEGQQDQ
jgi:hypothetical protein